MLFVYGLIKQVDELDELDDAVFLREEMIFATIFLSVLLVRFIYMRTTRPTALPADSDRWVRLLAKAVHLGMYGNLALLGISGLIIGSLYGSGVRDGITLAVVMWLHEACYWGSVITISLHVVGAIYHRRLNDGIWQSMMPWSKG